MHLLPTWWYFNTYITVVCVPYGSINSEEQFITRQSLVSTYKVKYLSYSRTCYLTHVLLRLLLEKMHFLSILTTEVGRTSVR